MTERKPFFGFHNPTAKADAFKNTPEQNRFFDLSQILLKGLAEGEQILLEISWSFASPEERESLNFPSCIFCKRAIFPSTTKLTTIYNNFSSFDTNLILLKHKLDPIDANLNSQKRKLYDECIGIFGFSILAIFRSVFRFLYQKTSFFRFWWLLRLRRFLFSFNLGFQFSAKIKSGFWICYSTQFGVS